MATPGVPANFSSKPGPEPQSLYVNADTVTADPTVDTYSVYVDTITGVGKAQFKHKHTGVKPDQVILGLRHAERYFVSITAQNSEAEGTAATEVEVVMSR